jgi:hypothetical protein
VHEQAARIASNSSGALSIGIIAGILVSLWSAMSGIKAVIDALNVIYEQKEDRTFLKLNLVALVFTLAGFAAFLLAIAAIVVLPLILSPIGLGTLTEALTRIARWPVLLVVLLSCLAVLYRYGPDRRAARWQWVTVGRRVRGGDVDRRVVLVFLVSRELRQLQCHLRFARRRCRPYDLAMDFDNLGSLGRRAQRRDRASNGSRFHGWQR